MPLRLLAKVPDRCQRVGDGDLDWSPTETRSRLFQLPPPEAPTTEGGRKHPSTAPCHGAGQSHSQDDQEGEGRALAAHRLRNRWAGAVQVDGGTGKLGLAGRALAGQVQQARLHRVVQQFATDQWQGERGIAHLPHEAPP